MTLIRNLWTGDSGKKAILASENRMTGKKNTLFGNIPQEYFVK
jgi:hypothetical protein